MDPTPCLGGAIASLRCAAVRAVVGCRRPSAPETAGPEEPSIEPTDSSVPPVCLRITSRCKPSVPRVAVPDKCDKNDIDHVPAQAWHGFCACCKRPLYIEAIDALKENVGAGAEAGLEVSETEADGATLVAKRARTAEPDRYAYVCAIWGSSPEYLLGAMVLGWSLLRVGSKHDLVVVHTADLALGAIDLLQKTGWKTRLIEHVPAADRLSYEGCSSGRFAQVFTKLRVLGLIEYAKILMLDIDLLVRENIDELFTFPAPMAMVRGPEVGYEHGESVDGSLFFGGAYNGWGQSSGINAGVMLLKPDAEVLAQMLEEVADPAHPEHIRGNGPEQDYLSRFYAGAWKHLSVGYNFQLHQMFFAVNPGVCKPDRLAFILRPELIKVIHYSSVPKPWARALDSEYRDMTDDEWLQVILESFLGYRAWVQGESSALQREAEFAGLALGPDGKAHRVLQAWEEQEDGGLVSEEGWRLGEAVLPDEARVKGAIDATRDSQKLWWSAYRELQAHLNLNDLASIARDAATNGASQNKQEGCAKGAWASSSYSGYSKVGGWWAQKPIDAPSRAVVACGLMPRAFAVLSIGGAAMLEVEGEAACHQQSDACIHVVAHSFSSTPVPPPKSFSLSKAESSGLEGVEAADLLPDVLTEAVAWATAVPDGATVMLGIIFRDIGSTRVGLVLKAMEAAGLDCPSGVPTDGCRVAAAVGIKGKKNWYATHAAADYALACLN